MAIKTNVLLSTVWIFVTINYLYCDVFTLFHSEDLKNFLNGKVGDMVIDQNFLLTFSIILEIPIVMILVSRIATFKVNRIANIVAGVVMTLVQSGSLFAGDATKHYIFFSIIEICTTLFIIWTAVRWRFEVDK
jgi:hypothetical protein